MMVYSQNVFEALLGSYSKKEGMEITFAPTYTNDKTKCTVYYGCGVVLTITSKINGVSSNI